jgi:AraC-like DNA-binding protein
MPSALTFLAGQRFRGCTARLDKRFEGYFTLQFIEAGGVELFFDDRRHVLEGPWFWTCYPGPRVRFHPAPGHATWEHRYVAFRGPLVARWAKQGLFPLPPQRAPKRRDFAAAFDDLLADAHRGDALGKLRAINRLESILLDLAEDRARPRRREPWLDAAFEALAAEPPFAPDYGRVARRCGMVLSTLRRRFRAATGTPLHAHLLQRRVADARRLLSETDEPIKSIAATLGYNDVYFFSRQFRQQVGAPPAAYRKSRQG